MATRLSNKFRRKVAHLRAGLRQLRVGSHTCGSRVGGLVEKAAQSLQGLQAVDSVALARLPSKGVSCTPYRERGAWAGLTMCRVLAYLGQPVLLDDLLYSPDSSLVKQAYAPKMLPLLNLAGFGMAAWDPTSCEPETPFVYKTPAIPVFDSNLKQLARKIRPNCLLAHVRGVTYSERAVISLENIHPFRFEGFRLALAHNGDLARFAEMKYDLLEHIRPEIARQIKGTTDSEWIYALVMSQVEDPTRDLDTTEITQAVSKTLSIIRRVRERNRISTSSSVNLFLSDGNDLVATRFTFDFGCYPEHIHAANLRFVSLWYTCGREYGWQDGEWKMIGGIGSSDSVIVSSEPLTRDVSTWLEVPEYSMLFVSRANGRRKVVTIPLDV